MPLRVTSHTLLAHQLCQIITNSIYKTYTFARRNWICFRGTFASPSTKVGPSQPQRMRSNSAVAVIAQARRPLWSPMTTCHFCRESKIEHGAVRATALYARARGAAALQSDAAGALRHQLLPAPRLTIRCGAALPRLAARCCRVVPSLRLPWLHAALRWLPAAYVSR